MTGKRSKELQEQIDHFVFAWTPPEEVVEMAGGEEEVEPERLKEQLEEIVTKAFNEGFEEGQSNYLYDDYDEDDFCPDCGAEDWACSCDDFDDDYDDYEDDDYNDDY